MVLPVTGLTRISSKSDAAEKQVLDQFQTNCNTEDWLQPVVPNWQEFCPNLNDILIVDVHIGQWFSLSPPITLSIESPLGTIKTQKTLQASTLPSNQCDWVTFDVPDVSIVSGVPHYIVLTFDVGSEYAWCGSLGDPYDCGVTSSAKGPDWDYCFRTYGTKSKSVDIIENSFLSELLQRLIMHFPILERLLAI
jgi:hypothetical protein